MTIRQHCVVTLGSISYYVRNRVEKILADTALTPAIVPAVVFNVDSPEIDEAYLQKTFKDFEAIDDVFNQNFTTGGILYAQYVTRNIRKTPNISQALQEFLRSHNTRLIFSDDYDSRLREGPYFLKNRELHQAWRLYEDSLCSFVTPVVPADSGDTFQFQPLSAGAYSGRHLVAAVPSRLYYPPSQSQLLNGKRITVKDNFHLSGVVTTVGSQSYAELYGIQTVTSTFVQSLIDQGAVIVGKTKMSAYAGSEVPPEKCIDYFPPWNPRGDGYQGPSGSSSGAGSSVAGYNWVDIAVGTDTTGSIRMPAASYGLWGMKATQFSFSTSGLQKSVEAFDAIGLLARTSSEILNLYEATGMPKYSDEKKPTKLIYPTDFYPMANKAQQMMQEEFLRALEDILGIKHTPLSLEAVWAETRPAEAGEKSLREYMEKSGEWVNFYDGYHTYDDFREEYHQKFGKKVYSSPFMTNRWQSGIDVTLEERNQGLHECNVVAQWLTQHVFMPEADSKSTPVMLIPFGRFTANYRDIVPPPGKDYADTSYSAMYLSSVLGVPQVVVPIGQNPYDSRVSGNVEYAPIVGSLMGTRDTDATLLHICQRALDKAGWPSTVLTGRRVFEVGDNTRHSTGVKVASNL